MFIFTARLSKTHLIAIALGAVLLVLAVAGLSNLRQMRRLQETGGPRLSTPEARLAYIADCGYEADPEPVQVREVRIPAEFTDVYTQYNRIQQAQGLDLSRCRGKAVTQYVYRVTNYPGEAEEPVLATLIIYKNRLVGADLSREGAEGFLRPLSEG